MVVNVKAVCKSNRLSCTKISGNLLLVKLCLLLIIDQNHDDIRLLCRFIRIENGKAVFFRFCSRL